MSEYQYFEFQVVDRPLTPEQLAEPGLYSTRARITPTTVVNEYRWGNFRGDEDAWMERYLGAFLHIVNWAPAS